MGFTRRIWYCTNTTWTERDILWSPSMQQSEKGCFTAPICRNPLNDLRIQTVFTKSMPKSTAWWVWHIDIWDIWQNHSVADILIPWCPTRWKTNVRIHFDVLKTRHCICIFMGIWCVYVVWYANIHKYPIHTRVESSICSFLIRNKFDGIPIITQFSDTPSAKLGI